MIDENLPFVSIPEDLSFDDAPMLPEDEAPRQPTPASALSLWRQGIDRSTTVAATVAAIAAADPSRVRDDDLDNVDECLLQALDGAPKTQRQSLQLARCAITLRREDFATALQQLNALADDQSSREDRRCLELRIEALKGLGNKVEADALRRRMEVDNLLEANLSSLQLRSRARELTLSGFHSEAERIDLHLVKRRFELGSTHCHLARIYLLLDRFDEAFGQLDLAEQHCSGRTYVRARTIFLRVLQCYMKRKPTSTLLRQLRDVLCEPGAFEEWSMHVVVEHLKSQQYLLATQADTLATLVDVLSDVAKRPELDKIKSLDAWMEHDE
jgi:hypothetical protein